VPEDVKEPVEIAVKLRYRKFDHEYLSLVYKEQGKTPQLPIVDICEDKVTFAIEGGKNELAAQTSPIKIPWQRWNDYGIACFIEGGAGAKKGELRQAEEAFTHLLKLGVKEAEPHAYVNLARIYFDEGRLGEAVEALNKAQKTDPPAPWWTAAWFNGLVNAQNGHLDDAIQDFEKILDPKNQPVDRNFNFTRDYVVINELASALFRRSQQEDKMADRLPFLQRAITEYERTLKIEPEDLDAHYGLSQCYAHLASGAADGDLAKATSTSEPEGLIEQAKILADPEWAPRPRLNAAASLTMSLDEYVRQPLKPDKPKLPTLQTLISLCRPATDNSADPEVKTAAAKVLSLLYRQTHAIYKPDDNAKDRAIRIYRENHPAAAAASQAIVIYPANRSGAPGLAEDQKNTKDNRRTASR
jgi:tetratricopeptide (TPR) repeat protein